MRGMAACLYREGCLEGRTNCAPMQCMRSPSQKHPLSSTSVHPEALRIPVHSHLSVQWHGACFMLQGRSWPCCLDTGGLCGYF